MRESSRDRLRHDPRAYIRDVFARAHATHYELLGLARDASRDEAKENYHLLMSLLHPDRQDPAAAPWPADCAQRVNDAYAVIADDARRAAYDAGLRQAAPHPPLHAERSARTLPRSQRWQWQLAQALVALAGVAATLFLLELWIDESSTNDDLARLRGNARDVATNEPPRFIGAIDARAQPLLAPLPRKWSLAEVAPTPALPKLVERANPAIETMSPIAPPALLPVVAQASAIESAPGAIPARDIEMLVGRLVGFYEAGQLDNLVALLDQKTTDPRQAARTREDYGQFFRATRQRQLRVKSLVWNSAAHSAHASGEAVLLTEYFDRRGTQERTVPLEIDIALRNGQPIITRLALLPGER